MSVWTRLRDRRDVWRPSVSGDGAGGRSRVWARVGDVRCAVSQATTAEERSGSQWSAEHSHSVYLLPDVDVRRGDELRGGHLVLRVLAVVEPSRRRYRKALCSAEQPEG